MSQKFIIFRATLDLVKGLDEVIEYLKANSIPGIRVTKTDAFRHLLHLFKESHKSQKKIHKK